MRILHINAIFGRLSTGSIVRDIHDLCLLSGIESYVACPIISPGFEGPRVYKMGNLFDEKVHALLSRITGKQAYYSFFSTLRLLNHINNIKPDIIHLHNLHNNFINMPMLIGFLNKHGIKIVISLHDCWFYTGGCTHYTHLQCYKWQQLCGRCKDNHIKIFDSSRSVLEDRILLFKRKSNITVIGVSDWIRKEAIQNVFEGCSNFTIYNGVDFRVFHPVKSDLRRALGLENKVVIIGPATKWLDASRRQNLLEFASQLKENEVLLLFGCKDTQLKVPKGVLLYGFTHDREELAKLYSMADVFANCSYEESLSLINIECQACGTPVVTFDNTGMAETVDGISGLRVQSGDYSELLKSCRRICSFENDELKGVRLSFIRQKFDKIANYQKMIDIYKTIV